MMHKVRNFVSGSIKRKMYLLTGMVALIMLLMVMVFVWTGNTLRMTTAIARFERTHTVSRVEAIVNLHKYIEERNPDDLKRFRAKLAITQSYNYVFGSLIRMGRELSDDEFASTIEKTFSEADRETAEILVQRIHVLSWHPLMKELVEIAQDANEQGQKMESEIDVLLKADNEKERYDVFKRIEKIEKKFNEDEISFSSKTGVFASETARIVNIISFAILLLSVGGTGFFSVLIIRSISVPMGKFIEYSREVADGKLDVNMPEISGDELLALKDSMSTLLKLNQRLKDEIDEKDRIAEKLSEANRLVAESEIKQKSIISNISEVISIMGADGIIKYKSSSIEKYFGWRPEEIIGNDGFSTVHPADMDRVKKVFYDILEDKKSSRTVEYRYKCKDGSYKPIELTAIDLTDDPVINGVLLNYHDITDRKLAENALRSAEELYKNLVETSQDLIWQCDVEGRYTYLNSAWTELFGYAVEEMLGKKFTDFQSPEFAERDLLEFGNLLKGNSIKGLETVHVGKNGKEIYLVFSAKELTDSRGNIVGTCGTAYDITDRKKAAEALMKSEDRYKKAQKMGHVGNWEYNIQTTEFWGSDEAKRIYGFDPEQQGFSTEEVENCIPEREWVHQVLIDLIEKDKEYNIEFEIRPKNTNEARFIWSIAELVKDKNANPLMVSGVIQDITERKISEALIKRKNEELNVLNNELNITISEIQKANEELIRMNEEKNRAEEALKQSNAFLNSIIESPKDIIIFSLDMNGNYTSFNDNHKIAMKNLYGAEIEINSNLFDLLTNLSDREQAMESFRRAASGEHFTLIQEFGPSDRRHSFEISYNPIFERSSGIVTGVTVFIIDVTERVKLEFMLLQSQKMEAIGTLAGGIAHDFNNILGGIVGYTQLASLEVPNGSDTSKYIEQILKASYRARDLVQQILTFSRQTEVEKKPVKLEPIVKEVVKLLKASLPSTIEIILEVKEPQIMINANPTHIHQVLMNLCTNAKQAIGNSPGKLTIAIEKTESVNRDMFPGFAMTENSYLLIKVSDTGKGIPLNLIPRIFEPYFTTKEKGEGTGLGLAVVHRIIAAHGGGINVVSSPGVGTVFTIAIPSVEGLPEFEGKAGKTLRGGNERVLFVDDESVLVDMTKSILKKLGYDVIATTLPEHALEILRRNPDDIDILITDMTMPKLTGEILAIKAHEVKPNLPIILCTGFSESISRERSEKAGIGAILLKPVIIESFSETIRDILDNRPLKD